MVKAQSAMEYLLTYSWALMIAAGVIAALFLLGIFTPNTTAGTGCVLIVGFSCPNVYVTSLGVATINILQATPYPINVTAIGCNTNSTPVHMQIPLNPPSNQISIQSGANYTFSSIQCYAGGSAYSGSSGSEFTGYLIINYTNTQTGLPQTIIGKMFTRVT